MIRLASLDPVHVVADRADRGGVGVRHSGDHRGEHGEPARLAVDAGGAARAGGGPHGGAEDADAGRGCGRARKRRWRRECRSRPGRVERAELGRQSVLRARRPTGLGSTRPATDTSGIDTTGTDTTGTDTTGASTGTATTPATSTASAKHVFVIALTTSSFRAAFGQGSVAHYLNGTLRRRGTLLTGYRTLGGSELPDYLAMVSGQAPNADTRDDCATYAEFPSGATARSNGQVPGLGCVYPNTVLTIADQVTAAGEQWRAYLADMGNTTCMHPDSNAADDGPVTGAGSDYTTRHNPFIYFHSLLDLGGCSSDDVGLTQLTGALHTDKRAPTYAFIAPGLCDEPSASPCPTTEPTGLAAEDAFLKRWVPPILASAAYKQDGVLMIVFARAPASTASAPMRTGALILSPLAKAGSTVRGNYNPYSVLRSVEDMLGYTPLAHAKSAHSFATAALPGA